MKRTSSVRQIVSRIRTPTSWFFSLWFAQFFLFYLCKSRVIQGVELRTSPLTLSFSPSGQYMHSPYLGTWHGWVIILWSCDEALLTEWLMLCCIVRGFGLQDVMWLARCFAGEACSGILTIRWAKVPLNNLAGLVSFPARKPRRLLREYVKEKREKTWDWWVMDG